MNRDIKALVRRLEAMGHKVTVRTSGHLRIDGPGGIVHIPSTPSDHRSIKNVKSQLRRIGVHI